MKLSVVIPTYTLNKELETTARNCVGEMRDADELIVVEDGGMYSPVLQIASEKYIFHYENYGFTKNVNLGLKVAEGDYIAVVNSDISFLNGELEDLCIPGKVTSPITRGQDVPMLAGHFFVIPRTVLNERGFLNESMRTFCSDAEYEERVKDIFEQVPTVFVDHDLNTTLKVAGLTDDVQLTKDRKAYEKIKNRI